MGQITIKTVIMHIISIVSHILLRHEIYLFTFNILSVKSYKWKKIL